MAKTIEINIFDSKSVQNGINEIKNIKKILKEVIPGNFVYESLIWIRDRANEYHDKRVGSFPNTINVTKHWDIVFDSSSQGKTSTIGRLINRDKRSTFVEFGTGLKGKTLPHQKANEINYEYDVNNHNLVGWNWYNEEFDIGMKGFIGYEGKSFLYDAFLDYFYGQQYAIIYRKLFDKYIK